MNPSPSSTGPIEFSGLRDEVVRRLREQILSGRLGEGDRIIERDVAHELGLSRGPIRDALRQLEHEGLIVLLPRRGARVASITREDAEEFIALRAAVEPVAMQFAIKRQRGPEPFEAIEDCFNRLRQAAESVDWDSMGSLHMEFHELVYTLSGSKRLQRVWELLRVPVLQTFPIHPSLVDSIEEFPQGHSRILEALKAGRTGPAMRVARQHVLEYGKRVLESGALRGSSPPDENRAAGASSGDYTHP